MEGPYITYNSEHSNLEEALESIDRTGDFFAEGRMESLPPRMSVSSVGRIAYPILDFQLQALIEVAERAPYGRGPDTLLDRSVRDCWQIGAEDVQLRGRRWKEALDSILENVAAGMGLPSDKIKAELYKLLVYEPGGFFAEHRDTEKADWMVGTLVIGLPVEGRGGELEVRHAGRDVKLDLSVDDLGELPYAAFYADCVHRTQPVRTGHRVSLVFNLLVRPGAEGVPSTGPDLTAAIDEVGPILADWPRGKNSPVKLAWILDHKYSEEGLSFDSLKGRDLLVGRTLAAATRSADCVLHLAVLQIRESGIPEDVWLDYDEGGKEIDYTGVDCDLYEVGDLTCNLMGWVDPDGRKNLGSAVIPLGDGEALPTGAMQGAEPDKQTLFEATGNGGVSISRSYRAAAFVIWPRPSTIQVMADGGIEEAVNFVVEKLEAEVRPEVLRERREAFVRQLLDLWPPGPPHTLTATYMQRMGRGVLKMLELLVETAKPELTYRFLQIAMPRQYHEDLNPMLMPVLEAVSPDTLRESLPRLVRTNTTVWLAGLANLLAGLSSAAKMSNDGERLEILRVSASNAFNLIPAAIGVEKQGAWAYRNRDVVLSTSTIRDLFLTSASLSLDNAADKVAALMRRHTSKADPHRAIPCALQELHLGSQGISHTPAIMMLWRHAARYLLARSASPPGPEAKGIEAPVRCDCEHCLRLKDFCRSEYVTVAKFKKNQSIRGHLESEIRHAGLGIKCETLKKGMPHTLVCTKTQAGFDKRRARYDDDVDAMRMLVSAAPNSLKADLPQMLQELRQAIERSE